MARRHVNGHKYRKQFNNRRKYTRAINQPNHVMRGGIRL